MMTPEGKVKKLVSDLLKSMGQDCYHFMPVQAGYGMPSLDYMGTMRGKSFAIETKAPGKKPTARQLATIRDMRRAGVEVFVIDGPHGEFYRLKAWLHGLIPGYSPAEAQVAKAAAAMDAANVPSGDRYIIAPSGSLKKV